MNEQNLKRFWRDIDDSGSDNDDTIKKNIEIIQYHINIRHLTNLIKSKLRHAVIAVDAQILLEKAIEIILKDTATIMYLKQLDEYYKSKVEKLKQTKISSDSV